MDQIFCGSVEVGLPGTMQCLGVRSRTNTRTNSRSEARTDSRALEQIAKLVQRSRVVRRAGGNRLLVLMSLSRSAVARCSCQSVPRPGGSEALCRFQREPWPWCSTKCSPFLLADDRTNCHTLSPPDRRYAAPGGIDDTYANKTAPPCDDSFAGIPPSPLPP